MYPYCHLMTVCGTMWSSTATVRVPLRQASTSQSAFSIPRYDGAVGLQMSREYCNGTLIGQKLNMCSQARTRGVALNLSTVAKSANSRQHSYCSADRKACRRNKRNTLCRSEADDSAAGELNDSSHTDKTQTQPVSILGMTSVGANRSLSMQQRWRSFQLHMKALQTRLVEEVAWIRAMVQWYDNAVLSPYRRWVDHIESVKEVIREDYEQYLAEETKQRWSWEKRNRKEIALLERIPPYIGMVLVTLVYQAFIPLSLSFAVLLPLYFSWVLYDAWWASPIMLGMIIIAPWKFLVRASWHYIWPGLI